MFQCPQLLLKCVPHGTESPVLLEPGATVRMLPISLWWPASPRLSPFLCLSELPTPDTTCYGFLHSWDCP